MIQVSQYPREFFMVDARVISPFVLLCSVSYFFFFHFSFSLAVFLCFFFFFFSFALPVPAGLILSYLFAEAGGGKHVSTST